MRRHRNLLPNQCTCRRRQWRRLQPRSSLCASRRQRLKPASLAGSKVCSAPNRQPQCRRLRPCQHRLLQAKKNAMAVALAVTDKAAAGAADVAAPVKAAKAVVTQVAKSGRHVTGNRAVKKPHEAKVASKGPLTASCAKAAAVGAVGAAGEMPKASGRARTAMPHCR